MTASSTRAHINRGVDTATSTPHKSSNIHSLLGWFTRATVRGTPNSVLASSECTRLVLSSPVAAIATSQVSSSASSNEANSQASASSHSASGTLAVLIASGALSTSSTWWPLAMSSRAIERPTLPAPAITTRIRDTFQCFAGGASNSFSTSASRSLCTATYSKSPSW